MKEKQIHLPKPFELFIVMGLFLAIMYFSLAVYELPIHLALIAVWFVLIFLGIRIGHTYDNLQKSIVTGIFTGLEAILIIIFVGTLIGSWIAGGIVPTLIYFGLQMIHPSIFLLATLLICSLTSIATGTSWGTAGTAGIAMMGIGESFGLPLPLVAGAVVSGAYFGDKLSPISDSTVMTASLAKVDLIKHVKSMLLISFPALVLSGIMFLVAGFFFTSRGNDLSIVINNIQALSANFNVSWYMLIPMVVVIVMLMKGIPAMLTLAFGSVLGIVWAIVFQGMDVITAIGTLYSGFVIESGVPFIDLLFNRGGIESMLGVIAIMILALGLGGLMEQVGILTVLTIILSKWITNAGRLTSSTIFAAFLGNFFGSAGYVSLITGCKVTEKNYDLLKIDRRVLSRNMETGGILTSPLVPWADNGIYMAAVLGVSTMSYLPFAWLNLVGLAIALFYGFSGKFIWYTKDVEGEVNKDRKKTVVVEKKTEQPVS
ncbi:Na+/H+ antiporter NhaC [Psychrobacillus soli]|uniref:Na+/H+ antiporter NhaC n=1 Tax=Psychrobacillus soli TaxID=1543965 RepID=A0A544T8P5_9BACI|nr:Na+/H+ antiporter NhaC [Psychrobacillus soli]TQR13738.1 Na+/H+ antiporter NhaC [Psychrobacillus soli]